MTTHAFGTQNIRHAENKANIQGVLKKVREQFPEGLDVLAMQELTGTNKNWITESMPGWRLWFKQAPTNGTGLIWKTSKWDFVRQGLRVIYKPHRDGPVEVYMGDPKPEWRRYAAWVMLKDRITGEVVSFISAHGKLGDNKGKQWKRLQKLVNYLRKFGMVHLAGDLNARLPGLPTFIKKALVLSEGVDHIATFGARKIHQRYRITKAQLRNLVDHPGIAIGWSAR